MTGKQVFVLGSGNFGTALAHHLANKGEDVTIWVRRPEVASSINSERMNPGYLKNIKLSDRLKATSQLAANAFSKADTIILAPDSAPRKVLLQFAGHFPAHANIVCASKGIEVGSLMMPMSILDEPGKVASEEKIAVISGPSFAIEVAQEAPTAVSVASKMNRQPLKFKPVPQDHLEPTQAPIQSA